MRFFCPAPFLKLAAPTWGGAGFFAALLVLASTLRAEVPGTKETPSLWDQDHLLDIGSLGKTRSDLEEKCIAFDASYTGEVFGNPVGGVRQATAYDGLLDAELTIDLKKLANWDGTFHASTNYSMGQSLTGMATHDLLGVSSLYSYNTLLLFELWYEQRLFNDHVSLRLGQMGADQEFFVSSHSALFLGQTYGWPGIIDDNAPTPNAPYGALGVRLRADPDDHWTVQGAIFSGNPAPDRCGDPNPLHLRGTNFDNSGTAFNINGNDGAFAISELWFKLNQGKNSRGLPGTYKLGGWYHSGSFSSVRYDDHGMGLADPDSDGCPQRINGNGGLYFIADQALWQRKLNDDNTEEIGFFLRGGNADGGQSLFDYYIDGGLTCSGLIPGRPGDSFGIATAYAHISSAMRGAAEDENAANGTASPLPDGEQNIEATYSAQIAPWWTVQPDIQYIVNPGGSARIPDAFVLGCRVTVTF